MAAINKLSIRGVRAFSPEDEEQVVEFYFPITIIVGQNGCGKTTIIEALKYAITGTFPPGSGRSGSAFVHDAKCLGQSTVKANVKLRFTSRSGQSMVVVRSMELTQKKTTQTFKQLDGVLRMMDPETGQRVSLSHKCTELDRELPQLLGVSKPILEHVIFCHQEDASWPLMEGAVLKKRFDDIFDSTKYSKALKVFRQTEKDFLSKVKDYKIEVAAFGAHKQAAEGFRKELRKQIEEVENLDEMKKDTVEKIAQVEANMAALSVIMEEVEDLDNLLESSVNDLSREKVVVEKQRSMLEEDLAGKYSPHDLNEMLRDFHQKMAAQVEQKKELEAQCDRLSQDIEKARQEEVSLTSRVGKLSAEKEAHEKNLRERYNKMENIAQTYGLDLTQISQSQGTSFAASLSQTILGDNDDETATLVSITAEDMRGFFRALEAKEAELRANLKEHRDRSREEEDKITSYLTELGGKLQTVENDKARLADERKNAEREMKELKEAGGHRIRKVDVEELRRKAVRLAEERDELNKDPRRGHITKEIRDIEDTMEKLKRKIDDESIVLESLKHTADAQNSLVTLQEQCDKELDGLDESIREESYSIIKFDIAAPAPLPRDSDDDGDQLSKAIEALSEAAREKYDSADARLSRSKDETMNTQKIVSEKSALLSGSQKALTTVKSKLLTLEGSVADVQRTVEDLRRHEAMKGATFTATEDTPRELVQYLDERLEELEEDAPDLNDTKAIRKVIKRLKKMAKVVHPNGEFQIECPCCKRSMDPPEVEVFQAATNELLNHPTLFSTDPSAHEQHSTLKMTYQTMRKAIESKVDDLRDFRRLTDEAGDLEKETKRLQDDILHYNATLKDQSEKRDEAQAEVDELRELIDTIRRWSDDAGRVAEKKLQIYQKKLDLSVSVTDSTRDLRTVDRQIAELREQKEAFSNKILRLNKEMSDINHRISEISTSASNVEKHARDKEEKYATELKAVDRRKELMARIQQIGEEEKKLSDLIAPLQTKKKKKEAEKLRMRSLAGEEEQGLQSTFSMFDSDVKGLHSLAKQIDAYLNSDKPQELEQISSKVANILDCIAARKGELLELEPSLEALKRAVDDQERHKKMLKQNIDILEAGERMKILEREINDLQDRRAAVKGHDTVHKEYATARQLRDELQQKKANFDGQFTSHVDQIFALKRKLSSPEYKNVDEEHRVAMIKQTTTKVAAEDLKKYGNALDKALLKFHGVKIREINKIIKELWMLTYKGEDITNIEIQSGQEPGSKADKSYNYRVVMEKGGSKMDMRGRCSAGQRVLTSIVIRLALAETFGLNCGVVALDEPTVNLDFENKKSLAIALSHIVANRAQQRNFQLIMITHDEDFVAMMKTELSSLTGFSMPDKYFQVCREEAADGKFYSKINAIDWDEIA